MSSDIYAEANLQHHTFDRAGTGARAGGGGGWCKCVNTAPRVPPPTRKHGRAVRALFVIVFSPLFTRRVHTVFASTRAYECLSTKINGQFVPGALSPVIIILSTVTRESAADLSRSHYLLALVFDSPTPPLPPPPSPTRTDLFEEFA